MRDYKFCPLRSPPSNYPFLYVLNFFLKKRKIFYDCYYQCSYVINRFYTRESLNFFFLSNIIIQVACMLCVGMYFLLMIIM